MMLRTGFVKVLLFQRKHCDADSLCEMGVQRLKHMLYCRRNVCGGLYEPFVKSDCAVWRVDRQATSALTVVTHPSLHVQLGTLLPAPAAANNA